MEQVGQLRRIDLGNLDVVADGQLQVGQHRVADLVVQAADLGLDVFGFTDVGTDGARLFGHLVQHGGVDVIADPEGEDAGVVGVLAHDVFQNLVGVGLANGRAAV